MNPNVNDALDVVSSDAEEKILRTLLCEADGIKFHWTKTEMAVRRALRQRKQGWKLRQMYRRCRERE